MVALANAEIVYMFYKFMKKFLCFQDIGNTEFRIYDSIDVVNTMFDPKKHIL
jgi:hypothetical protein